MGRYGGQEMAVGVVAGSFSATGQSAAIALAGRFNVTLWGGTATVQLERSFDGGSTWAPRSKDTSGAIASYAVTASAPVSCEMLEPEAGVLYRLNCTANTSATQYRLSR